jgi:hypothetical protein
MTKLTSKKATMWITPKYKGYIMYQGPSALTGDEIVVIATMKTTNGKTGDMVQVWILDANMNPVEAVKTGQDESVCGNCPHRKVTCYVNVGQAPNAIFKAFKRGLYPVFDLAKHAQAFLTRYTRLGAYGDPAAAPFDIMALLATLGLGHTGYTHQAAHKGFDKRFIALCQVSADTPKQAAKWQAQGAKTFRVALEGDSLADNEIECLADSEGIQCIDCGLCNGVQQNIAITVHGSRSKNFKSAMLIPAINLAV